MRTAILINHPALRISCIRFVCQQPLYTRGLYIGVDLYAEPTTAFELIFLPTQWTGGLVTCQKSCQSVLAPVKAVLFKIYTASAIPLEIFASVHNINFAREWFRNAKLYNNITLVVIKSTHDQDRASRRVSTAADQCISNQKRSSSYWIWKIKFQIDSEIY